MAANKNTNDDADAIVARISIAQARLEASLRSFFPPPSKEDLDPEEKSLREREEEELFKPEPEPSDRKAGILGNLRQSSADEQLRKLFLKTGRAATHRGPEKRLNSLSGTKIVTQPRKITTPKRVFPVEDEEEVGRSSLVSAKRRNRGVKEPSTDSAGGDVGEQQHGLSKDGRRETQPMKRPLTYLDEVLIEREQRKKKKSTKKQRTEG